MVVHVEKQSVLELNKLNPNDTILIFTTGLVIHFTTVQIFYQIVRQFVNVDASVVMDIVEITKENVSKLINANCHHVHQMNFVNVSTLHVKMLFVKYFLVMISVVQQKNMMSVKEIVFACPVMPEMIRENVFLLVNV